MFDPLAELERLVEALDAEGIEYALCGALALAVHGAPRATRDIDILARPEDLGRLRGVAARCGFTFEALPMTFPLTGIAMRRFTKLVDARPFPLDILLVNDALRPLLEQRLRLPWQGRELQVVSRDALVVMKTTAGRPQDLVDVQRLMEIDHERR
jgi:hypothetical protein